MTLELPPRTRIACALGPPETILFDEALTVEVDDTIIPYPEVPPVVISFSFKSAFEVSTTEIPDEVSPRVVILFDETLAPGPCYIDIPCEVRSRVIMLFPCRTAFELLPPEAKIPSEPVPFVDILFDKTLVLGESDVHIPLEKLP